MQVPPKDAVFVDPTGRRRSLVAGVGLGLGGVLLAAIVLLIAGLSGATPGSLPGLPGSDHALMRGAAGPVHPQAAGSPSRRLPAVSPTSRAVPTTTPAPSTALSPSPSATPSPTGPPGHRRTAHPGNPKPSRSK